MAQHRAMAGVRESVPRKGKKGYGGRGRPWSQAFIEYMEFIAHHPTYRGMPDAFVDYGRIQWEAPSNRTSGRYKDTHAKRREWWRQKAESIGINPTVTPQWISRTAKTIHPTGEKPCKICGRLLSVRYVHPQQRLLVRLRRLPYIGTSYQFDRLEPVSSLIGRLVTDFGDRVLEDLPTVLRTSSVKPPDLGRDLDAWLRWIESEYVPSEPSILSPGAMSNAPDRFDGFHSDNLCCRGTADKGRHPSNLATYATDRRVFEYWTEGDWIAADRMAGQAHALLSTEACQCGHPGPCTLDHIGPLSLGFTHRPVFQLLCASCNSAKNNRMTFSDVLHLRESELAGEHVISWHSRRLWDLRKESACDDETALRLSKLLRDARHSVMYGLNQIAAAGHFTFLVGLLELEYADYDVDFAGVHVEGHTTAYTELIRRPRETKYAEEQKARRCRVAFKELLEYFSKENRNAFVVTTKVTESALSQAMAALDRAKPITKVRDWVTEQAARCGDAQLADERFRRILRQLKAVFLPQFDEARQHLQRYTDEVANALSQMWDDDRYVRTWESEIIE
jgi:Alw26I/Eco31I/Esp3I family type II restriction endonuclease